MRHFFDKTLTIRKLRNVSGYKENFPISASIEGCVQSLSNEEAIAMDGVLGRTYKIWADVNANIVEGDKIQVENTIYTVKTVQKRDEDYIINQHLAIIAEKVDGGENAN